MATPLGKYFVLKSRHCDLCVGADGSLAVLCVEDASNPGHVWYEDLATGTIQSKEDRGCLTVGSDDMIVLAPYNPGDDRQQWKVDGAVIRHRNRQNQVLDIKDSRTDCGAGLCSWKYHGGTNQQWEVKYLPPRLFYVVSELSGKVLDIAEENPNPGAKLIVWDKKAGGTARNQLWYEDKSGFLRSALNDFVLEGSDVSNKVTLQPFDPKNPKRCWGIYGPTIFLNCDKSKVLDILDCKTEAGAEVGIYDRNDGKNQRWYQTYVV